jgi:hypothetical protein
MAAACDWQTVANHSPTGAALGVTWSVGDFELITELSARTIAE